MTNPLNYRHANNHEDGPFRQVTSHEPIGGVWQIGTTIRREWSEILECGHHGHRVRGDENGPMYPVSKRRCRQCRTGLLGVVR